MNSHTELSATDMLLTVLERKLGKTSRPSSLCLVVVSSLGHPSCFYHLAGNFHKRPKIDSNRIFCILQDNPRPLTMAVFRLNRILTILRQSGYLWCHEWPVPPCEHRGKELCTCVESTAPHVCDFIAETVEHCSQLTVISIAIFGKHLLDKCYCASRKQAVLTMHTPSW